MRRSCRQAGTRHRLDAFAMKESLLYSFVESLRDDLPSAGMARAQEFYRALEYFTPVETHSIYWCGRFMFCTNVQEIEKYEHCFFRFFGVSGEAGERGAPPASGADPDGEVPDTDSANSPAANEHEYRLIARATEIDLLKQCDFAAMTPEQRADVYALIQGMRLKPPKKSSRRLKDAGKGRIHAGRTVRAAFEWLGEVGCLKRAARRTRTRRCVFLFDVSGSMRDYADPLAIFGYSLVQAMPAAAEVFALGTRLTRLTPYFRGAHADAAMRLAAEVIHDWHGGTRLGVNLKQFLDQWGRRGLARGAVFVIASDGWESGGCELLAEQMARLHRFSHRVVWLNPHKSSKGYEPSAAGMRAALPHVDAFVGGASFNELAGLNRIIADIALY